jgi:hypothetical protein
MPIPLLHVSLPSVRFAPDGGAGQRSGIQPLRRQALKALVFVGAPDGEPRRGANGLGALDPGVA